jgi:hypothetical protein
MKTIMSLEQLTTLDAIKQFLDGTQAVAFNVATDKAERYRWVQKTLVKHRYLLLGKADRGTVTRYLIKVTGYSLAQTKRLIRQYVKTGTVSVKAARRNGFKRAYTDADIRLLASMDERHGQPSGPVLKKLCERAYHRFGQAKYRRLAGISVSHLYNLQASKTYAADIVKDQLVSALQHPADPLPAEQRLATAGSPPCRDSVPRDIGKAKSQKKS